MSKAKRVLGRHGGRRAGVYGTLGAKDQRGAVDGPSLQMVECMATGGSPAKRTGLK